jgi:uncharacterized protein (DUF1499 family)
MNTTLNDTRRETRQWARFARLAAGQALTLAILALLCELAAGVGYRNGWWELGGAFTLFRWGAWGAVLAALLAVADLGMFLQSRRGLWLAVLALLIAVPAFGLPAWFWYAGRHTPPVHDISTDTANPPKFVAIAPLRRDARNPVEYDGPRAASLQKSAYPDIAPLDLDMPPADAFAKALAAARAMGWTLVAEVPSEGRIEAIATTRLMGFKDDVVIRVTPTAGGSRVDVRSKSRIGRGDFGTNARRVQAYLKELRSRL